MWSLISNYVGTSLLNQGISLLSGYVFDAANASLGGQIWQLEGYAATNWTNSPSVSTSKRSSSAATALISTPLTSSPSSPVQSTNKPQEQNPGSKTVSNGKTGASSPQPVIDGLVRESTLPFVVLEIRLLLPTTLHRVALVALEKGENESIDHERGEVVEEEVSVAIRSSTLPYHWSQVHAEGTWTGHRWELALPSASSGGLVRVLRLRVPSRITLSSVHVYGVPDVTTPSSLATVDRVVLSRVVANLRANAAQLLGRPRSRL